MYILCVINLKNINKIRRDGKRMLCYDLLSPNIVNLYSSIVYSYVSNTFAQCFLTLLHNVFLCFCIMLQSKLGRISMSLQLHFERSRFFETYITFKIRVATCTFIIVLKMFGQIYVHDSQLVNN